MKKVAITIGILGLAILFFCGGFYSGWFLSDYDILCEKDYTAHMLNREFTSKEGVVLPEGTVVYLRGCKPNTDVRLEFFIDNWNYQHTEKLIKDPMPAYYLDIESAGVE